MLFSFLFLGTREKKKEMEKKNKATLFKMGEMLF
jgi:hypothetical protein